MKTEPKAVWIGGTPVPPNVRRAVKDRWRLVPFRADDPPAEQFAGAKIAVICADGQAGDPRFLSRLVRMLDDQSAIGIFLLPEESRQARGLLLRRQGHFLCVGREAPSDELRAKFSAAESLQPGIRNLQAELLATRRAVGGPDAEKVMADLDEQMRLAARLQRDFLPRRLPEIGPLRFASLFRPISWVSGDIYDIIRLDETNVGFYVADAVGHGMPAALLTIFLKRALQTKRIIGNQYQIIPPHESLQGLNAEIYDQRLSSCQFCTAVYCVLDVRDLKMTFARAGHPEPILIRRSGQIEILNCPGALLGIFPEEQYTCRQVQLFPGDRLLVYSDGADHVFRGAGGADQRDLSETLEPLLGLGRDELLIQVGKLIDALPDEPSANDDVTVLVVDVER